MPTKKTARDVLYTCLDMGLRMLHPMIPFITEELYQRLPHSPYKAESVCIANYPLGVNSWICGEAEEKMDIAQVVSNKLRSQMEVLGINPTKVPKAYVVATSAERNTLLTNEIMDVIERTTRVVGLEKVHANEAPKGTLSAMVSADCMVSLDVKDVDLTKYIAKREKELATAKQMLENVQKKMNAPGYEKAKDSVKEENQQKLIDTKQTIEELEKMLESIKVATA